MSEEVRKIVKMLKDGQINEDEAVRLLEAATRTAPPQSEEVETGHDVQQQVRDAVKSAKAPLNWPGLIWRMALLVAIPLLLLAIVVIGAYRSL